VLPVSRARGPLASGPALLVMALLVIEVLVFAVSTLPGFRAAVGADEGFDPLFDGWLQGAGYVTAAVLAVLRPLASRVDRAIWAWLAAR
jgi:hypothetical protein